MSRRRFDQSAAEAIAKAVREIESNTDAEVVVVVRGRSGSYRHVDYLWGAIFAFLALLFLLFSPFDFHTYWVPLDVIAVFLIGAFFSSRSDLLRRLLTTSTFREKAARAGSAAMFYEAGIANTMAETGLLIYWSLLERRIEVLADRGVLKAVPALKWNDALFKLKKVGSTPDPDLFVKTLRELGAVLAEDLPATGKNPNELADGPRIELK